MRFLEFLTEQKEKHAVLAFGRLNPITSGHEKLVNKVKDIAKEVGGTPHIVVSHSQDEKKNPLSAKQKIKHAKRAFPDVHVTSSDEESPNFLSQAVKLHKQGVTHLHMVAGQDRIGEYHKILHKYNGVKASHGHFNFKDIKIHSAGDRDPDAEGVEGMSASKMREHASKGNFKEFRKGVPSKMTDSHARDMYNDVRKGMNIREDLNDEFEELLTEGVHDKAIFKAVFLAGGPGSGKDYVLDNTLSGHGLTEINSDKAFEFLMDKNNLDMKMPDSEEEARNVVRGRAKSITELRQRLALFGRNGLIINGTGDDPEKIAKIKERLEQLGYDTSMLMVNTRDEVSASRNVERGQRGGRTVPEKIRKEKWDSVQKARPELAKLFGDNYREFENSEDLRTARPEVKEQKQKEMLEIFKNIQKFVSKPPKSEASKEWIANELQRVDTSKINTKREVAPHEGSKAAEQARKLGLQYFGFGRYGKDGHVTHRSVHDRLVDVGKNIQQKNEDFDIEFENFLAEDLRKWFDPKHPKGGWKRINSKGEAIGPCAREPGEAKPKCMSNEKRAMLSKKERASAVAAKRKHDPDPERKGDPINVSNFGKGKLSESYDLSDSGALNILLLGNRIDEIDLDDSYTHYQEEKKYMTDKNGKIRVFMLRRAAAREAHTKNGKVIPYKNGYVVQLNEENENDISRHSEVFERPVYGEQVSSYLTEGSSHADTARVGIRRFGQYARDTGSLTESIMDAGIQSGGDRPNSVESGGRHGIPSSDNKFIAESNTAKPKITLFQIRSQKRKTQVEESIDKGIEPGLSMAASGENLNRRGLKTKQNRKPFEEAIGAGSEDMNSMSDKKEDDLKKAGISLTTFKSRRPIG